MADREIDIKIRTDAETSGLDKTKTKLEGLTDEAEKASGSLEDVGKAQEEAGGADSGNLQDSAESLADIATGGGSASEKILELAESMGGAGLATALSVAGAGIGFLISKFGEAEEAAFSYEEATKLGLDAINKKLEKYAREWKKVNDAIQSAASLQSGLLGVEEKRIDAGLKALKLNLERREIAGALTKDAKEQLEVEAELEAERKKASLRIKQDQIDLQRAQDTRDAKRAEIAPQEAEQAEAAALQRAIISQNILDKDKLAANQIALRTAEVEERGEDEGLIRDENRELRESIAAFDENLALASAKTDALNKELAPLRIELKKLADEAEEVRQVNVKMAPVLRRQLANIEEEIALNEQKRKIAADEAAEKKATAAQAKADKTTDQQVKESNRFRKASETQTARDDKALRGAAREGVGVAADVVVDGTGSEAAKQAFISQANQLAQSLTDTANTDSEVADAEGAVVRALQFLVERDKGRTKEQEVNKIKLEQALAEIRRLR